MKKLLAFLTSLALALMLCVSPSTAQAGKPAPTKQDVLVMKHTMLTLWSMDITSPRSMDAAELCRYTLLYLMRGQVGTDAEFSGVYPARFANLPEKYTAFFSRQLVEKTARLVFNGWISESHLPAGVFLGAAGFYIDTDALYQDIEFSDDAWLPSYAAVESMFQQPDGTVILNGKLRRFKSTNDSINDEILWGAAPFMARFVHTDEGWQLTSFVITAEAMG